MSEFIDNLGINIDDVLDCIETGAIGDAFLLCRKYVIYCWSGKKLNRRMLCLNKDEFMSEAYIAFHYSSMKYDRNKDNAKAFLDYFSLNLERHLFYVNLDSNFVSMSKCYRNRRKIDKVVVDNFAPDIDPDTDEMSVGITLSSIPSEDDLISAIETAELLDKLLENVLDRDIELLLNPMEHPYDYFIGEGLSASNIVRATRSNWIKKLRRIAKSYV